MLFQELILANCHLQKQMKKERYENHQQFLTKDKVPCFPAGHNLIDQHKTLTKEKPLTGSSDKEPLPLLDDDTTHDPLLGFKRKGM